ncbi:VWA domain-containing protein [Polyangium aurulentum]|uniref:VWA domain-containing protein n=1 Tax=Polyangium aurulentum TaxID=2567896 RepID=UPI00146DEE25|nr:VWA domain-containing protein [Polyangium aurulentum]UQA62418.1 VWA domain-containing protein [Polyangium aurulentum]
MSAPLIHLSLSLDVRGLLPGVPTRAHLVADIRAAAGGIERERPPLSVVFAVDVSGSMTGPPIEQVAASIDRVVGLLEPHDRVGVAVFSDGASEVVPLVPLDADAKRLISSRVHRLVANGWTNMESGMLRAAKMMPQRGRHERQVILLLSDGAPNKGKAAPAELAEIARSFRPDIALSTLGYGAHHNEDVLARIAEAGAGRYHFIADPAVCEMAFAQAIGVQGDAVAEAISLQIFPAPGVEITRFFGAPDVRFGAGGLKLAIADLLDGSRHVTVAEVELKPPREPGPWQALRASLAYRRAGEREEHSAEALLSIPVGPGWEGPHFEARERVLIAQADEARAEARKHADRGQFEGAAAVLRRMIGLIEREPGFVRNDGSPLAETLEQLVDEAVAMERKPNREAYAAFRKAQVHTPLASSEPPDSSSAPMSSMMVASVAGVLPRASLVIISGERKGERYRLDGADLIIGRTSAAQICIADANISRQHARITAQRGRFFVADLGSTNTTRLNGHDLVKPTPLSPGDVLLVGSIELRYEEDGKR